MPSDQSDIAETEIKADDRIQIRTPAGTLTLPAGATINDAIGVLQRLAEKETHVDD